MLDRIVHGSKGSDRLAHVVAQRFGLLQEAIAPRRGLRKPKLQPLR